MLWAIEPVTLTLFFFFCRSVSCLLQVIGGLCHGLSGDIGGGAGSGAPGKVYLSTEFLLVLLTGLITLVSTSHDDITNSEQPAAKASNGVSSTGKPIYGCDG